MTDKQKIDKKKAYDNEPINCPTCNKSITRKNKQRHNHTKIHKANNKILELEKTALKK